MAPLALIWQRKSNKFWRRGHSNPHTLVRTPCARRRTFLLNVKSFAEARVHLSTMRTSILAVLAASNNRLTQLLMAKILRCRAQSWKNENEDNNIWSWNSDTFRMSSPRKAVARCDSVRVVTRRCSCTRTQSSHTECRENGTNTHSHLDCFNFHARTHARSCPFYSAEQTLNTH